MGAVGNLGLGWPWAMVALFLYAALWLWNAGRLLDDAQSAIGYRDPADRSRWAVPQARRKAGVKNPVFNAQLFLRCQLPLASLLIVEAIAAWAVFYGPPGLGELTLAPDRAPTWLRATALAMTLAAATSASFVLFGRNLRIPSAVALLVIAVLAAVLGAMAPALVAGATFASLLGFATVIAAAIVGVAIFRILNDDLADTLGPLVIIFSTAIAFVSAFAAGRGLSLMVEGAGFGNPTRANGAPGGPRAVPLLALAPILTGLGWSLLDGRTRWGSETPELNMLVYFLVLVPGAIAPFLWLSLSFANAITRRERIPPSTLSLLTFGTALPLAGLLAVPAGVSLLLVTSLFDHLHVLGGGENIFDVPAILQSLESGGVASWWIYAAIAAPALGVLANLFASFTRHLALEVPLVLRATMLSLLDVALLLLSLVLAGAIGGVVIRLVPSAIGFTLATLARIANLVEAMSLAEILATVGAVVFVTALVAFERHPRRATS